MSLRYHTQNSNVLLEQRFSNIRINLLMPSFQHPCNFNWSPFHAFFMFYILG